MKKLILFAAIALLAVSPALEVDAAAKKARSRTEFTKKQQKKFYDEALKGCRKKFGASLHYVKMDYRKFRYVCYYY